MSTTAFRALLALSILLGIVAGVVDLASQSLLPPLMQLHYEGWVVADGSLQGASPQGTETLHLQLELDEWPYTAAETVGLILMLPLLVAVVIMYVGLFRLRAWGAWLMLVLTVLRFVFTPLTGAVATTGWAITLYDTALLLEGVILAVVFVGPMRQRFFGATQPFGGLLAGTQSG